MLADVELKTVLDIAGIGRLSAGERYSALQQLGVKWDERTYPVACFGDNNNYRHLAQYLREHETVWASVFSAIDPQYSHAVLIHKGQLYDPYHGVDPMYPWHRIIGYVNQVFPKVP